MSVSVSIYACLLVCASERGSITLKTYTVMLQTSQVGSTLASFNAVSWKTIWCRKFKNLHFPFMSPFYIMSKL